MNDPLFNPAFAALCSGDRHLGFGTDKVKAFEEQVSPFAGFEEGYADGFDTLYDLLPPARRIVYATPRTIETPKGWKLLHQVAGVQMLFQQNFSLPAPKLQPVPLGKEHIDEMMALAALTKPGPFGPRTIEFGHYFGFFENGRLTAMAGQRMHVEQYTEISAVCTHPGCLGKGFASALLLHLINFIREQGQVPFLHVRGDNQRAIDLYERSGFVIDRPMNFSFLQREI